MRALQARRGLAENGTVDVETSQQLTADPLPTLFERCLGMTAQFEDHGFGLLQGNFDGAGLTWGITGFTLKSREIQALLGEAEATVPGTLARVLGPLAPVWQGVVARPLAEQIAWADSIRTGPARTRVPPDWKDAFARLGDEPTVKRLQMQRAHDKYLVPACGSARTLDLRSELGIELAFDVHVQNGRFKPRGIRAGSSPAGRPTRSESSAGAGLRTRSPKVPIRAGWKTCASAS